MIETRTPARPRVALRQPGWMDVRQFVRIEEKMPAPHWAQQDFSVALGAEGIAAAVAEVNSAVVGFLLYRVEPPPEHRVWNTILQLLHGHWTLNAPRQIDLLHIAVAPECQRRGIGRALLDLVHQQFRRSPDRFQAIVPETNLPIQLFLRDAGYRATLIVSGGAGGEDRYLMERPPGP